MGFGVWGLGREERRSVGDAAKPTETKTQDKSDTNKHTHGRVERGKGLREVDVKALGFNGEKIQIEDS